MLLDVNHFLFQLEKPVNTFVLHYFYFFITLRALDFYLRLNSFVLLPSRFGELDVFVCMLSKRRNG